MKFHNLNIFFLNYLFLIFHINFIPVNDHAMRTKSRYRASLKMYFGQCFHTPNETSKECIQFLNK
jgi:hypothetical protein